MQCCEIQSVDVDVCDVDFMLMGSAQHNTLTSKEAWHEEVKEAPQLQGAVLYGRAAQHKPVLGLQPLDSLTQTTAGTTACEAFSTAYSSSGKAWIGAWLASPLHSISTALVVGFEQERICSIRMTRLYVYTGGDRKATCMLKPRTHITHGLIH